MTLTPTSAKSGGSSGGGVTQLAYVEFTASVTVSGSEGSPTDVVSAGALTFDGATRACIEFYAPFVVAGGSANSLIVFNLWDGVTDLGQISLTQNPNASGQIGTPVFVQRFLTPSGASHTYKIRGWMFGANGTVFAGAGGVGVKMPGWVRITTA